MNLLSINIDNIKEKLDKDKETIKFYAENNTALSIRNKTLSKKVEKQSNRIEELEEENFGLKQTIRYFKDKFNKLKKLLQEKLFSWGRKDLIYKQVVDDLYNKNILDNKDIKSIEKDDYEL